MAVPKSKRSVSRCKTRRSVFIKQFLVSSLKKKNFYIDKKKASLNSSTISLNKKNKYYKYFIIKFKDIEKQLKNFKNN